MLHNVQETQWQAILLCNIAGACRPGTMRRLDWRTFSYHLFMEGGVNRARVTVAPVKSKARQFGSKTFEEVKEERVTFVCGCPLGTNHNDDNQVKLFVLTFVLKECIAAVMIKHHGNVKTL